MYYPSAFCVYEEDSCLYQIVYIEAMSDESIDLLSILRISVIAKRLVPFEAVVLYPNPVSIELVTDCLLVLLAASCCLLAC